MSEQQEEDEEVVYLFHLKVKANNYIAPFSVSVTAVLQQPPPPQLINDLERCSFILLQCFCQIRLSLKI